MGAPPSIERWSIFEVATSLFELACAERATAHVLLGWLPKIPDLALKLDVAEHQHRSLLCAAELHRRATGLLRATGRVPLAARTVQWVLTRLDGAPDPRSLLGGVYGGVLPALVERYRRHGRITDPIGDGPSLQIVGRRIGELEELVAWGRQRGLVCPRELAADVAGLWAPASDESRLEWSELLWAPLARVSRAARPVGLPRVEPGSLGLLTVDSLREPRDVGIYLHSDLDEEITTLELVARNSYEHPRMPDAFHSDMSRQVADEARHARQMLALLRARGLGHGDFPVSTSSYDGLYEFSACEPGGAKELLWRMLIRQTFMEGLALDSLARDVERRRAAGQEDIARALELILGDEVFHAASGLRWCRHLLGDAPGAMLQARYEAVSHYTTTAEALRARFVEANLEKAMGELTLLEEGKRRRGGRLPEHPLNRLGRKQAGFSDDDILQILSWGYATE
jgi:uncharacterized ferritin-like protein (DUF455 family)